MTVLLPHCAGNAGAARKMESEIYMRAHTSIDVYLDVTVRVVRRLEAGKDAWGGDEAQPSSSSKDRGISSIELQSFFHVNWGDILSEEARFSLAQCSKCRSREIYTVTAQLRSADEGMSVMCTCQRCGLKWTES